MNRLFALLLPSRRVVYGLDEHRTIVGALSATRSYATVPHGAQYRRRDLSEVRTLRPDKFASVSQTVHELSHKTYPAFRVSSSVVAHEKESSRINPQLQMTYYFGMTKWQPFPSSTKGVFHLHYVPGDSSQSQIRFRLCDSPGGFQQGEDLRLPDGTHWGIPLRSMARAPTRFRRVLALLRQEFSIDPQDIDFTLGCHREVSTLDPRKLPSSCQEVMNISGLRGIWVYLADKPVHILYAGDTDGTRLVCPTDSTGVLYYKQSLTAPTRLGELRFRLCRSVQEFDGGADLCSPSGDIWHLSSLNIQATQSHKNLRSLLIAEGLLDDTFYSGTTNKQLATPTRPLQVLADPLVIDLSASLVQFNALDVAQSDESRISIRQLFQDYKKPTEPLFGGRVVVRFEEYPELMTGDTPRRPLLRLRFLEMLTPVKRLSENDYMKAPKPGELLMVRGRSGEYRPWSYNPTQATKRKFLTDWIARSRTLASGEE